MKKKYIAVDGKLYQLLPEVYYEQCTEKNSDRG